MKVLENISLAPLTTFGIGGPARWFIEATSEAEVVEASEWARGRGVSLFVLGGGSNVLVADVGFAGLVLHVAVKGIARDGDLYHVGAGNDWDGFVEEAVLNRCAGIECLAGIPGTVGGTPVQNVGAYGQEVASSIESVRAFDLVAREFVEFANAECGFAYRRSRFNSKDRGRYVVTRVDYRLRVDGAPNLRYADVQRAMEASGNAGGTGSLAEVAAVVRQIRRSKGMLLVEGDADARSAGSFFKNPAVTPEVAEHVRQIAADLGVAVRDFPAGDGMVKIPAAWLIEQSGFAKGYRLGGAGISTKHTLALTNRGGAKAEEVLALAAKISAAVEAKFGIRLEREPELVGFGK